MVKLVIACMMISVCLTGNVFAIADSPQLEIARKIYFSGDSQAGLVTIEGTQAQAPAALFPCVNCHGDRAQGKKETGVVAPDINLHQLQRAYRRDLHGGSRRQPYTSRTFRRVLVEGINSDGNLLDSSMPRYRLTEQETDSLFAFLGNVHETPVRGVSENSIRVGVRLPKNDALSSVMRATVKIYSDKLSATQGIYNRKIQFIEMEDGKQSQPVFCVVDLSLLFQAVNKSENIEISVFSKKASNIKQYALYQHPFSYAQMSDLVADQESWKLISVNSDNLEKQILRLNKSDAHSGSWTVLQVDTRSIEITELFKLLETHERHHKILLMNYAQSAIDPLIKNYPGDVFLLRPPGLESVSKSGRTAIISYLEFDQASQISSRHLPAQLWTLAALSLLTDSLEIAGDSLTEDRFEKALQQQIDFDSSFGPRLSYSASKRVGNSGILAVKQN